MLWILSAEMQKWFDQNHTSRSVKADLGGERGFDAQPSPRSGRSAGRGRGRPGPPPARHVVGGLLAFGHGLPGGRARLLLLARGDDLLGLPLGVGVGDRAEGLGAARQRPLPQSRLARGLSSSASSAPRGSDSMAAIDPGRGPMPKRCSASAASAFVVSPWHMSQQIRSNKLGAGNRQRGRDWPHSILRQH